MVESNETRFEKGWWELEASVGPVKKAPVQTRSCLCVWIWTVCCLSIKVDTHAIHVKQSRNEQKVHKSAWQQQTYIRRRMDARLPTCLSGGASAPASDAPKSLVDLVELSSLVLVVASLLAFRPFEPQLSDQDANDDFAGASRPWSSSF